ncbi:MAG TPA: hypothetical protein VMX57_00205 [Planctomycetota bacterium]|nr:hypothetical protein [Planctomycetota bacterium]
MNIADENVPLVGQTQPVKIAIAMATHEIVPATFMYDLASLVAFTAAAMPEGAQLGINMVSGTYVHRARQQLLKGILADGDVTHVLWVDTDMRFPRESLALLLRHNLPVVGINYAKREIPTDYVAIEKVPSDLKDPADQGKRLVTTADSTGLARVDALGFGLVLIKTSALKDLPDPGVEPWFWFEALPGGRQMGEDVYFCRLLKQLGVPVYVDQDLSKHCAHVGQFDYKLEHVDFQKGD